MSFLDEKSFAIESYTNFVNDVELTFCSFLSKFTYSKNLKTGTIHLKMEDAGSLLPELKLQVDDDFDFDINGIV